MKKTNRSWDVLYGRIDYSALEYDLITTPEIQRLRYIRMCNINSMLVTGASEISRFEHTLGVLRLAQEWISVNKVSATDANNIRAAAILHDMQTGPFGHSLQYVFEDNSVDGEFLHDDIKHGKENLYYQNLNANASFGGKPFNAQKILGENWRDVANLIAGNGVYGPLISGTMDIDNIDNVVRLAYHVGVAIPSDAEVALQIVRDIKPIISGIEISQSSITNIERWQKIRSDLYNLLLLDWAEFSAKAMLTKAMEKAIDLHLVGTDSWLLTDNELISYLLENVGQAQEITDLIRRIKVGDLYEPILMIETSNISIYDELSKLDVKNQLEQELVNYCKNDLNISLRPIFHFILDKGKTNRAVSVIIRENQKEFTIGTSSRKLLIGVFVSKLDIKSNDQLLIQDKIKQLIVNLGATDISEIEDPMGLHEEKQCIHQLQLI